MEENDEFLLEQFVKEKSESAFEKLVKRYSSLVLGVCRRATRNEHDANDACQAAFLVLSQKAGSIRKRDSLRSWLHRVAVRAALELKNRAMIRQRHEEEILADQTAFLSEDSAGAWDSVKPLLDEEIDRLPDKYRSSILLCYFDGKTSQQAAQELGISDLGIRTRLARARDLLGKRLTRRGVVLSGSLLTTLLIENASAAISTPVHLAVPLLGSEISPQVAVLSKGVMKTMFFMKVKTLVMTSIVVVGIGTGGMIATQVFTEKESSKSENSQTVRKTDAPKEAQSISPKDSETSKVNQLSGIVQSLEGDPISDAQVIVATTSTPIDIEDGKKIIQQEGQSIVTDSEGRFSISTPPEGPCSIVVLHELGYANQRYENLTDTFRITLYPWGRIEGKFLIDSKPVSNRTVFINFENQDPVRFHAQTITDESGSFVFERVRPGLLSLSPDQGNEERSTHWYQPMAIVKNGETVKLDMGDNDRPPVIGRVVIPNLTKDKEIRTTATLLSQDSEINGFYHYFILKPDEPFRIEGVPSGNYEIQVEALQKTDPLYAMRRFLRKNFVVPQNTENTAPVDLGRLEFQDLIGATAPEFEFQTLDKKSFKLINFKGKYILLNFWASWCSPSVGEFQNLKTVYKTFGNDERFCMINLSLDDEPNTPQAYVRFHQLKWIQGFLGNQANENSKKVCDDYQILGIPEIMLIDLQGKIIATGLRGDQIMKTVSHTLNSQ